MKSFYVLRHGQTTANTEHRLQGQTDTHLNQTGIRQAEAAGTFLKERGIHPDLVITSPLVRVLETAETATGMDRSTFRIDPRIIEMGFGVYEMKIVPDLSEDFRDKFHNKTDEYVPPEGGESYNDIMARIGSFIENMRKETEKGTVLVVSHGAAIHAMAVYLSRIPITDFWKIHIGNCAIFKVILGERYEDDKDGYESCFEGYTTKDVR